MDVQFGAKVVINAQHRPSVSTNKHANYVTSFYKTMLNSKHEKSYNNVKISLLQAVEAHMVVRR
jgi:hypothetical protein